MFKSVWAKCQFKEYWHHHHWRIVVSLATVVTFIAPHIVPDVWPVIADPCICGVTVSAIWAA